MKGATSADLAALYIIRGYVADLPVEQQGKINTLADQIRKIVKENGEEGFFALSLVSAEIAVDAQ